MNDTLLRIDPSLPLCWESTETLRVGFDRAEVRLDDPTPRQQRFISLLTHGILVSGLSAASRKTGLSARERTELLDALGPVLQQVPAAQDEAARVARAQEGQPAGVIEVIGEGDFARMLRSALRRTGFEVSDSAGRSASFAILVERFIGSAAHAQHLLIYEIPHLPVVVSDRSMCIGPLVIAPGAPCLACVELHDIAEEPLRATLAAQLLSVRPGAETPACVETASAVCGSAVRQYALGTPELRDLRLRFPVRSGVPGVLPQFERLRAHRDCACVALAQRAPARLRDADLPP